LGPSWAFATAVLGGKTEDSRYGKVEMKRVVRLLAVVMLLGALASVARAQSAAGAGYSLGNAFSPHAETTTTQPQAVPSYQRPTEKIKLRNYLFDTFGPYPLAGAAILGGVNQAGNSPPEWGQGARAYGERVGSDFGIAMVTTTTRYALAEAFREDTLYYRCECKGVLPRLGHALISTLTARRGDDGHRQLSFPAMVAPYAGSMTAVYAWYPNRYDADDGFRMGNYTLLAVAGENIAREFIYGGPHTLFGRVGRSVPPGTNSAVTTNP
jgi:hypothetical protein